MRCFHFFFAEDFKEWRLLGQEIHGQLTVAWVTENVSDIDVMPYMSVGIYQPKTNDLKVRCSSGEPRSELRKGLKKEII